MARRNALLAEVFIFISCGLVLVSNGQGCLPNPGNMRSLVDHSPIVLEGRVEETRPAASQPTDSGLVDAVISLVTVFKGQVDGGSQERIVVGPFGASESTQICVGEARVVGDELVLFLSTSSNESAEVGALRHFRLMVNPVVADVDSRWRVKNYASPSFCGPYKITCIESGYCQNGGTCYFNSVVKHRYCECAPGFEGRRCEEKVIKLSAIVTHATPSLRVPHSTSCNESDHCLNGGSCFVILGQRYCMCAPGFEGTRCAEKVFSFNPIEMPGKAREYVPYVFYFVKDRRRCLKTDARGCVARQRRMISTSWSKIGFQTDSSKGVSLPGVEDSADDLHHSNGGGKLQTNVATSDDSARLLRPQKPEDVREPGLHRGRAGQNGPLKTGDLPVPV